MAQACGRRAPGKSRARTAEEREGVGRTFGARKGLSGATTGESWKQRENCRGCVTGRELRRTWLKLACAIARPSRRIENFRSHVPTMFWIVKSCTSEHLWNPRSRWRDSASRDTESALQIFVQVVDSACSAQGFSMRQRCAKRRGRLALKVTGSFFPPFSCALSTIFAKTRAASFASSSDFVPVTTCGGASSKLSV